MTKRIFEGSPERVLREVIGEEATKALLRAKYRERAGKEWIKQLLIAGSGLTEEQWIEEQVRKELGEMRAL